YRRSCPMICHTPIPDNSRQEAMRPSGKQERIGATDRPTSVGQARRSWRVAQARSVTVMPSRNDCSRLAYRRSAGRRSPHLGRSSMAAFYGVASLHEALTDYSAALYQALVVSIDEAPK